MKRLLKIILLVALTAATLYAEAQSIQVQFSGSKQGKFKGNVTESGRTDWNYAWGFDYQVASPIASSTGLATGKRQHSPVKFSKAISDSSIQFFQACVTNEVLPKVVIEFWSRTGPAGVNSMQYRITLTNARIASVRQVADDDKSKTIHEEVTLTFQRIDIELANGMTASDDSSGTIPSTPIIRKPPTVEQTSKPKL